MGGGTPRWARVALAVAALLVVWAAVVLGIVPWLIRLTHAGDLSPLGGSFMADRETRPLSFYLDVWNRRHRSLSVFVVWTGALVVLFTSPWWRREVSSGVTAPPPLAAGMSARRRWTVVGAIVCFTGLATVHVLTYTERWPFSPYAMYAAPTGPDKRLIRAVGLSDDGKMSFLDEGYTAPRLTYSQHIAPFDPIRMTVAIRRISEREQPDEAVEAALLFLWDRYEELRQEGRHTGPVLTAVALYEFTWPLDPRLPHPQDPTGMRLLSHVTADRLPSSP